jgi:hypothetical protein
MSLLFKVRNTHYKSQGRPPRINGNKPNRYVGYFMGVHGDQFIFVYNRKKKTAYLRTGDWTSKPLGWRQKIVVDYDRHKAEFKTIPGITLMAPETDWLRACWTAATELQRTHDSLPRNNK